MQGNVVQGRIHWSETNRAVPRLLSGIEAGVIGGIAMLAPSLKIPLVRQEAQGKPDGLE